MESVRRKEEGHCDSQELLSLEGFVKTKHRPRLSGTFYAILGVVILLSNAMTWSLSLYVMRSNGCQSCTETSTSKLAYNVLSKAGLTGAIGSFFEDIDQTKHAHGLTPWKMHESVYTAQPSNDVDQAWFDLGINYEYLLIPEAHAAELHLTHNHVYLPPAGNLTQGGYAANMDTLHQLHCVNVLRKATFYNHDYYANLALSDAEQEFHDEPGVVRAHINHCIDMIRELLMCRADTSITPYYWLDRHGNSIPDFARPKQCGNFDSLRQWAGERQTFLDKNYHMRTPKDVKIFSELYT